MEDIFIGQRLAFEKRSEVSFATLYFC